MSILSKPYFHDEQAAYDYVEAKLWPNGPVCPKCGETERTTKMQGASTRIGTYKCRACRKPFTVKVGTIFEASHIPMHKWLQAIYLMCSSKKGISSHQLSRTLEITVKSAWFMTHRIREAMRTDNTGLLGSGGGTVEVDETFIGNAFPPKKGQRAYAHKNKILSLLDRDTGQTRSMVVDNLKIDTLYPILRANIAKEAKIMTDDALHYRRLGKEFAKHNTVKHSTGEYVFAFDKTIHTNTIEGFFSVFKRGMKGVYQHCRPQHLNRYMAEYDFRYNHRTKLGFDDINRADIALLGVKGKRLTYERTYPQA